MYLAPQNIPCAISVLTLGNKVILYCVVLCCIVLCILVEVLSRAHAEKRKSLNRFKFGISIGRFLSGGVASAAMKGLRVKG